MDGDDEQQEEIDSLQYIYEEGQFQVIGANPNRLQIDVSEEFEDGPILACRLLVTLPPGYPNEAPTFEVSRIDGVTKEQCTAIHEHVTAQVEENLGMPMIFALSSAAKEWMQENGAEEVSEELVERRNKNQGFETVTDHPDEEVEVVLRRKGTPVTPESFAQWKAAFDAEMEALKKEEAKTVKKEKKGLTGRQMFESGAISATSDGKKMEGEEEVDFSAVRKEAKAEEGVSAEAALAGVDLSVFEEEGFDLDEDLDDLDEDD